MLTVAFNLCVYFCLPPLLSAYSRELLLLCVSSELLFPLYIFDVGHSPRPYYFNICSVNLKTMATVGELWRSLGKVGEMLARLAK